MSIEEIIWFAIAHRVPVVLRDGRKAFVVGDMRRINKKLGGPFSAGDYPVVGYAMGPLRTILSYTWTPDGMAYLGDCDNTADIVGLWREFDNWEALRPEVRFIAMDQAGRWKGFRERPKANPNSGYWSDQNPQFGVSGLDGLPMVDREHWMLSLVERPDTEDY